MAKANPMGATFAERAAAASGEDFTPPKKTAGTSTFAQRAGIETKPAKSAESKSAASDDEAEKPAAKPRRGAPKA